MTEEKKQYQKEYYEQNKPVLLKKQRVRNNNHYLNNKELYKEKSKKWKEANPERMKELQQKNKTSPKWIAYRKKYYQENKESASLKTREIKLKKYGLTIEQYNQKLLEQNSKCLICERTAKESSTNRKGDLVVDHCHKTGKVRGLLCHHCNAALGQLQDNPLLFQKAIEYLSKEA